MLAIRSPELSSEMSNGRTPSSTRPMNATASTVASTEARPSLAQ